MPRFGARFDLGFTFDLQVGKLVVSISFRRYVTSVPPSFVGLLWADEELSPLHLFNVGYHRNKGWSWGFMERY